MYRYFIILWISIQTEHFKHIFHFYQKLQHCLYEIVCCFNSNRCKPQMCQSLMYGIGLSEISQSLQWIWYMIVVNRTSYNAVQIEKKHKWYINQISCISVIIYYQQGLLILSKLKIYCEYVYMLVCYNLTFLGDSSCLKIQRLILTTVGVSIIIWWCNMN